MKSTFQPFNVHGVAQGVFPPVAGAQVRMPQGSDSYYLMTSEQIGPQTILFWHANTCHPETVLTLEGAYEITVGTDRLVQQAGDVLVIPAGVGHGNVVTKQGYRNLQIENTHAGCQSPPARINAVL